MARRAGVLFPQGRQADIQPLGSSWLTLGQPGVRMFAIVPVVVFNLLLDPPGFQVNLT